MELTAEQIQKNWNTFIQVIETEFSGERLENLKKLYTENQDTLMFAPASGTEHYHNCFAGGYIDHVLRVYEFTKQVFQNWQDNGATINYTYEELVFAALHHDLGKLGFPGKGNETYHPNPSDWHRKNQGKIYTHNTNNPFHNVNDLTVWLLQHYGITTTWNEMITIKLTDGLYDDANKMYYISRSKEAKLKTNMPYILHQADSMAARIEYEMWVSNEMAKPMEITKPKTGPKPKVENHIPANKAQAMFDDIFGDSIKNA